MSARDSFRRMAGVYDRYRGTDPRVYRILSDEAKEILATRGRIRMLDVGCGTGNLSTELAEEHPVDLTGIDVTPEMIRQAAEKHPAGKWITGDFEAHPFGDRFDLILMSYVIQHLKRQREAVAKAAGLLAAGGCLAVVTDDLDQFTGSHMHRLIPRLMEIDAKRFPGVQTLRGWLEEEGLETHVHEAVNLSKITTREEVSGQVAKVRARYISTLTYLTDQELEEGARRYEGYLLEAIKAGPVVNRRVKTIVVAEK